MKYKGKTVRIENRGIQGLVVGEDAIYVKIQTADGLVHVIDKFNNIITIVSITIKLLDLFVELWAKIKSRF